MNVLGLALYLFISGY